MAGITTGPLPVSRGLEGVGGWKKQHSAFTASPRANQTIGELSAATTGYATMAEEEDSMYTSPRRHTGFQKTAFGNSTTY